MSVPIRTFLLCLVAVWLTVAFVACQKVELPTEDDEEYPEGGQSASGDGNPIILPDKYENALTVAKVLTVYSGVSTDDCKPCGVVGYVVGYVDKSIRNCVFSSEGAVKSNLLLADRKTETDPGRCMPVQLESGSKVRMDLNLAENPEVLGKRVYLYGYVSKYFSVVGMREPESYEWVTDSGDGQDVPMVWDEVAVIEVDGEQPICNQDGD